MAAYVYAPAMPSDGKPRFSWNLRSASSVYAPKMPSFAPQANPSAPSACCSSSTSWPWKWGMRRYSVRSPRKYEASTSVDHTLPVTSSPAGRPAWMQNARTAAAVCSPNEPSTAAWSSRPMVARRCCTSSTAAPVSCRLMVSMEAMVPQAARPPASTPGVSPKEQSGQQVEAATSWLAQ